MAPNKLPSSPQSTDWLSEAQKENQRDHDYRQRHYPALKGLNRLDEMQKRPAIRWQQKSFDRSGLAADMEAVLKIGRSAERVANPLSTTYNSRAFIEEDWQLKAGPKAVGPRLSCYDCEHVRRRQFRGYAEQC